MNSVIHERPSRHAATRSDSPTSVSWIDTALQQVLTATYWLDPGAEGAPYPVTIRFHGRRTRVNGKPQPRDSFTQEERIDAVVPGSGPVSVTTRVFGINPGRWVVSAESTGRGSASVRGLFPPKIGAEARRRGPWPWVTVEPTDAGLRKTVPLPLARAPGVLLGAYPALVALGMILGVLLLVALTSPAGVSPWTVFGAGAGAVLAGLVGGKTYYVVQQRGKRFEGWCVQGFIIAAALGGALLLWLLRLPAGLVLNAGAPALFLGIAIGRPGCFFAGCCGGRATSARWGLWCSDQRVGSRRIPTQLLEALLALAIGLVTLLLFTTASRLLPGALLVGAVAAYALGRQLILPLRSDQRGRSSLGRAVTIAVAVLALAADVAASRLA